MNQINRVEIILPTRTRDNPNQGRVYDVTGIAPAICCGGYAVSGNEVRE